MTDQELFALTVLVESGSRMMWSADQERYNNCRAPAYGDTYAEGQAELEAELKRRGLFGRPDRAEQAEAELANQVARAQEAEQARDALQLELSAAGEREAKYREALEKIEEMTSNGEPFHGDMAWNVAKDALEIKENPNAL